MSGNMRHAQRLKRTCRITIELAATGPDDAPGEVVECSTRDLSRSGINVRLEQALTPGAIHQLSIHYFDNERPLQLTGEVRWSKPAIESARAWDAGIAVLNGRDTDVIAWENLLAVLDRQAV